MADLPIETIQLDILPRLPARSVFRFKCVCKQWQSFLSSDEFVMVHRNHITKSKKSYKYLIVDRPPWRACPSSYYKASKTGGLATFRPAPFEFDARDGLSLLASLDGLVLVNFTREHELVIWNPLTGAYKKLAESKDLGFYEKDEDAIGLYIDTFNDYKILYISIMVAYIYSLKMDSWRKINNATVMSTRLNSPATFFDGRLYFVSKHERLILSFDAKSEKFREIQYPSGASICGSLVVVKGCLRLFASYDMWQMIGDGWMKVVFAYSGIQRTPLKWTPICVVKNGEFLVFWEHDNEEDTKGFTKEQLCLYSAASLYQGVVYNETLVSPNI